MAKELMGVKMHDAGISMEAAGMTAPSIKEEKNRKDFPSFVMRNDQIPEDAEKYNVGDKCIVVAVVRIKSKEEEKREKQEDRCTMGVEIEELGFRSLKGKKAKDMSDEELTEGIVKGTGSKDDEE